jgi:hypothetical protein
MLERSRFDISSSSIVLNDEDLLPFGTDNQLQNAEVPAKSLRVHTVRSESTTTAFVLANVPAKRDFNSVLMGRVRFGLNDDTTTLSDETTLG